LRLCSLHHVSVVPQGGLTGLAGAAVPIADGIAVSLERMNAIESIEPRAATLCVQAGATVQSVQEAAIKVGLSLVWILVPAVLLRLAVRSRRTQVAMAYCNME